VEIARALVTDPLVLLMDEPFASLDHPVRSKIMMDLFRIQKERPVATIFVTHDCEEAFMLGDKIAVIEDGKIEQVARKDEIFYRPATRKVAKFFGAKNIFSGVVCQVERQASKMVLKNERFCVTMDLCDDAKEGDSLMFCIRPEETKILRPDRPIKDTLRDNIFSGKITEVVGKGAVNTIFFQMGDGDYDFQIDIPSHAYRDLELGPGKKITISLKRNSIWPISYSIGAAQDQRRDLPPL
jgi:molybdate transport system ATP-binding protein